MRLPSAREASASRAVEVIDDDLGRSGGGIKRPGFERLLVSICEGRAGMVLAVEASRLARNGRDWHTLLEFCGLVGCLLADEDGIYDPSCWCPHLSAFCAKSTCWISPDFSLCKAAMLSSVSGNR